MRHAYGLASVATVCHAGKQDIAVGFVPNCIKPGTFIKRNLQMM